MEKILDKKSLYSFLVLALICLFINTSVKAKEIIREAKNTITPVEMNKGDILKFKLRNGQIRTMILEETDANVIITNLNELMSNQPGGGTLYHFTCKVKIDGHMMMMERYVGSQESFYEPYVINGMRVWFDGVADIFDKGIVSEMHGACKPHKDARFAVDDMTEKICPLKLNPWYINKENYIDVVNCYNGDDVWMGAYNGIDAHGGLDINMSPGTPNFTPFPIDEHYLFNSLANGDDNNRWRGIRKWDNGDVWTIQNHHMLNLRIPEHLPINSGKYYADAAGVHSGSHHHAHYFFKIKTPENENEILLDPWIIFWQIFEDQKQKSGEIKASITPLSPGITNSPILFRSDGSREGINSDNLSYYWTFGDGGWSDEANPEYTYLKPGIYPVTLVVDDGVQKASFTQHITIDGEAVNTPGLALWAEDVPSFRIRPVHIMDVYGQPITLMPHFLNFVARSTRPQPNKKIVLLQNNGAGELTQATQPIINYYEGYGWLTIDLIGKGNNQQLEVYTDGTDLAPGIYSAKVEINCPGVNNGKQGFLVQLTIPTYPPEHREIGDLQQEIIDHSDTRFDRFYCTPYFWIMPKFHRWINRGYKGNFYLTNGGRASKEEYARFTPDLEAGRYEISLSEETPYEPEKRAISDRGIQQVNPELNPGSRFAVRVKSKNEDEIIWMEPSKSRIIGIFEFNEGMDGFVDILSEGSTGQVLIDAIIFEKLNE
jgi:PKD repeat protein